jgi:hypothetical protein
MKKLTKMKIHRIVNDYREMFPEEYELDLKAIEEDRVNLKTKFAEVEKTHAIKRALFSVGIKLDAMFMQALSVDEQKELSTVEGGRWFAKEFPQFSLTKV